MFLRTDGTNGRICRIGYDDVRYDTEGQIDKIGDKNVHYRNGKIDTIDGECVYYRNGEIYKIGSKNVSYKNGQIDNIDGLDVRYVPVKSEFNYLSNTSYTPTFYNPALPPSFKKPTAPVTQPLKPSECKIL